MEKKEIIKQIKSMQTILEDLLIEEVKETRFIGESCQGMSSAIDKLEFVKDRLEE